MSRELWLCGRLKMATDSLPFLSQEAKSLFLPFELGLDMCLASLMGCSGSDVLVLPSLKATGASVSSPLEASCHVRSPVDQEALS